MKPIIEKVLSSGLVDKSTAKMMEQWGYLPQGASEKVNEDALLNKTRETMEQLAEDLANEIEKEHHIRESVIDLERLRWPVIVDIRSSMKGGFLAGGIRAVVDRLGRYYFRIQDVKEEWFAPGYIIQQQAAPNGLDITIKYETMAERQILYIDDIPVCVQVSVLSDVSYRDYLGDI